MLRLPLTSRELKLSNPIIQSIILSVSGLILIVFSFVWEVHATRILSFSKEYPAVTQSPKKISENPIRIEIPSIQIDLAIEEGRIIDGVWEISYSGVSHLDKSTNPGEGGNIVIYGHNKKVIFGNLPYLSLGQKIIIKTQDGKIHTYEAYEKDFVNPDRVDLVSPTAKEELTIFTCWGLFDNQRLVVKAKPI